MTTTVYGIEGVFPDSQFAQMHADEGGLPGGHGVASGLAVTLSAGADRQVQIASGRAAGAGVVFYESAGTTLALPTNTSGKSRIDLVVAQWNWSAARAAFQGAGGVGNLDAASTAAQAAGGSFTSVQGTPGDTPVAPYNLLTQVPGDKWQEVLTEQLVRNNVGVFTAGTDDPVDVRRLPSTVPKTLSLSSGWSTASIISPLTVERFAGIVFFGGRLTRTAADLADTATFGDNVFFPPGFRPKRAVNIWVGSDQADAASPTDGHLIVKPNGTMALHVFHGFVATGQTLRVHDASWIGA